MVWRSHDQTLFIPAGALQTLFTKPRLAHNKTFQQPNMFCTTEIIVSQTITIRMITSHTVITKTYTIQLTTTSLLLTDTSTNEVLHSIPLDCIKHYTLLGEDNELHIQIDKYKTNNAWCSIACVLYIGVMPLKDVS